MPSPHHISLCPSIAKACVRIGTAELFDSDENRSQVLLLLEEPSDIHQVWFATLKTKQDVGVAMVSRPTTTSRGLPVLNVFVDAEHRHQGIGKALVEAVLEQHRASDIAAYYTADAVRLYHAHGFPPAEIHFLSKEIDQAYGAGDMDKAAELFVEEVVKVREEMNNSQDERPRRTARFG